MVLLFLCADDEKYDFEVRIKSFIVVDVIKGDPACVELEALALRLNVLLLNSKLKLLPLSILDRLETLAGLFENSPLLRYRVFLFLSG